VGSIVDRSAGDEFREVVAVCSLSLVYPWAGSIGVGRSGAGKECIIARWYRTIANLHAGNPRRQAGVR
jgi:hypothetical protein